MTLNPSIEDLKHKIQDINKQDTLLNTPDYDPTLKPANIELALQHSNAKRIYRYGSDSKHSKKCACCGLSIEGGQLLPMCSSPSDYSYYGVGYTLYFEFYKDCIILMFLLAVIVGGYSTYTNYYGNSCAVEDLFGTEYCV
jgi:hypothetical protein